MSDTRQIVSWALENPCQLRTGDNWRDPVHTSQTLHQIKSYAISLKNGKIVNGIWVWSTCISQDNNENEVFIPHSGVMSDEVEKEFGGIEVVSAICNECKANVCSTLQSSVAGCFGSIDVMNPYSEQLEALLWKTINQRGLEKQLKECFQITKPLWFGFWMDSPLKHEQSKFLLELLPLCLPRLWGKDEYDEEVDAIYDKDQFVFSDFNPSEHYGGEFKDFFQALKASQEWNLPLHVNMATPGHVDCGYYTCFAHCPRCKAEADVERWKEKVDSMNYQCKVCSYRFDPSTTHSSELIEFNMDQYDLEEKLGENFDTFAIKYGEKNGVSKQQMIEALDNHRDGPALRKVAEYRERVNKLEKQYAKNHLQNSWDNLPDKIQLEIGNGVVLQLQLIKPGEFQMGSPLVEDEKPVHLVKIHKPFYFSTFPITQVQWQTVMGSNPSLGKQKQMLPVEQVTWFDAQDYCAISSDIVGRHMRLPTEAEWEYVCRAGTNTEYSFGDELSPELANYDDKLGSLEDFIKGDWNESRHKPKPVTTPVDRFQPNPWGIYDMHGNVYEWCQDSWHADYNGAPDDGSSWINQKEPVEHVVRGGAANTGKHSCRSSARYYRRANYGVSMQSNEEDDTNFMSLLFNSIDYYGVRVACAAIKDDL